MRKHMLRYSEERILSALLTELGGREQAVISISTLTEAIKQPRSAGVTMLNQAAAAGMLLHRSVGNKGTWVKVLNRQALERAARHVVAR